MKECLNNQLHRTCQKRAWNGDKSKNLCTASIPTCVYKADFIHFKDVDDDTIMYSDDIESTYEFKTKAEWVNELGHDRLSEESEMWHTASVRIAQIDLSDLISDIEESEEMFEEWYSYVLPACEKDPIIEAGIKRLNEILADYPTYVEDLRVIFD